MRWTWILPAGIAITLTLGRAASQEDEIKNIAARKLYVTPEDFGAVANDDKCDSDAFDKLAEAIRHGVEIRIPARKYHISRTWQLPFVGGGRVVGMGGLGHGMKSENARFYGAKSELHWIGADGGAMVNLPGSNLVWDSVGLCGHGKAGIGLYVVKPEGAKGIGSGKHTLRGLSIVGCRIGIKLSEPGRHNVDNIIYEYTYIADSEVGVMFNAHMVIGHYFSYLHFRNCKVGVWARQGGDLVVRGGLNTSTGTFFKVGDTDGTAPGRNQGMYLFEGVKTDAQNPDLVWVDVVTPTDCQITFRDCHQAWGKAGPTMPRKFTLRGAVRLTIRDCVNLFGLNSFIMEPGTKERPEIYMHDPETGKVEVTGKIGKPNVVLDRCRVDFGTEPKHWIERSDGHYMFRVRDLMDGVGAPLKDCDY